MLLLLLLLLLLLSRFELSLTFFSFLEDFFFGCVFSSLFQRESQDHQFTDLEHFFVVVVVAVLVRGELDCFGSGLQNFSE
jgi:hypothetical protein